MERRGRRAHARPRRAPPSCSRRRCPSPGRGSLRVIPVLDLRAGRAVLARGGQRDTYAPVRSRLVAGGARGWGDPLALARAYRDILDCDEWYVADLDALAGGAVQHALLAALAGLRGRPLVEARLSGAPLEVAGAAVAAGAGAIIVLDLARVGSRRGVDAVLVAGLRRAYPRVELLAGGGIATARELERLADAGLDGALVATALHEARIRREDIAAARRAHHPSDSR